MFKRVGAIGVMGAVIAVAVATALSGTAAAKVAASASTVSCKNPVTVGVAYPESGPLTSIGSLQYNWAAYAAAKWNASHTLKINLLQGDTQLGNGTVHAIAVAQSFKNNASVVAVTGPAGSQEMQDTATIWHSAGLAPISGSETRVALTRSVANPSTGPRETTPGYFFRTVPNDGEQAATAAAYIHTVLKKTKVEIIDDSEGYSTGLRDFIKVALKADHVTVTRLDSITETPLQTDFSGVIAHIPSGTQLIYIPWQSSSQAENFYSQLHAAKPGTKIILMGADGTNDPSTFKGGGSYLTAFPYSSTNPTVKAFANAHNHDVESFGLPSYTATLANATAIQAACKAHKNSITRAQVRAAIQKTSLTSSQGLLGFPIVFLHGNSGKFAGPGDLGGKAAYFVYKIQPNGTYKRVQ
jgi:ABC-type branched-subunit amino acid transport system substrate-binding protein